MVKVAACQMPDVCGDIDRALSLVESYAAGAEREDVRLVCFPEAFLQGYVVERKHVEASAIDLSSPEFARILDRLAPLRPLLVLGLFEREGGSFFNSAVVVDRGSLVGRYRKQHLIGKEKGIFLSGAESPVFGLGDLRFSINICYDLQFRACATEAAAAGATLLVCPANNMLGRARAEEWRDRHNEIRRERARESGLWLLTSDVTGVRGSRVSYGPTALINPSGVVVEQLPLMKVGTLLVDVPPPLGLPE